MHRAVAPALLLACSERSAVVAMQRPAELEPAAGERAVAVELAAGSMHTCARMRDATVQCWGEGRWGQLGDGAREDQDPPVRVPGLAGVVDIDAEGDRTCAVLADGAVQCWGRAGADGRASPVPRSEDEVWTVPRPVAAWTRVQQIALSRDHDCALSDGLVRCLGANDRGQLGDGSTSPSASPVTPGALGLVDEIAVGEAFSCARVTGDVWCWGLNDRGQCGSDGPGTLGSPTRVAGLHDVRALALGQAHACALLGDDGLRCWGDNFQGQLGDGSGLRRRALVTVPVDHVRRIAAHHRQTAVVSTTARSAAGAATWTDRSCGANAPSLTRATSTPSSTENESPRSRLHTVRRPPRYRTSPASPRSRSEDFTPARWTRPVR